MLDDCKITAYSELLKHELQEATGCTEPIALALAGAKTKQVLGVMPDKVEVYCSGNIIKNVKAVTVPNSGGLKGIDVAVLLGMVGGDADASLQVISHVNEQQRMELRKQLLADKVTCQLARNVPTLYIRVVASCGNDSAEVEIQNTHSNFTRIVRNGQVQYECEAGDTVDIMAASKEVMNVADIIEYAETADVELFRETIERQIRDNTAISQEGLKNDWGERVGKTLMECRDSSDVRVRARAKAAAGSDHSISPF